jgi:5-methylcytosine-specific restriction endonuclease McrA
MRTYALSHVSDPELRRGLASLVSQDRVTTAMLLAHIAEFDARRLYLPAAYPSMFAYCVHELHLSEDAAYKRIQVARIARRFPAIFEAIRDGRLHLTSAGLLCPHLTADNSAELLAAVEHLTKLEIEELIARRFPRSEAMEWVLPVPGLPPLNHEQLAPAQVEAPDPQLLGVDADQLAPGRIEGQDPERPGAPYQSAPGPVEPRGRVSPVAHERFLMQLTIGRSTHDKLRHARNLLGHSLPSGDLAQVLDRALDALIEKLERRKLAASARPRQSPHPSKRARHIPAHVKRAVWERDSGQCTFVSDSGRRCAARARLEFDHALPVARGGQATMAGIRLRCRAHNQYEAERAFGAEFMSRKREAARRAARTRRLADQASRNAAEEVMAPLRRLGFSAEEARRAAALCETIPEASLEQRVRRALRYFQPRCRVPAPCDGSEAIAAST